MGEDPRTAKRRKRSHRARVRISDVAERAGVSLATVSRALRDDPSVTEATRAKVRAAAQDLGYTASSAAAALARGSSNTVGVVAPLLAHWFFSQVLGGINDVLIAAGYELLLYPVTDEPGRDLRHLETLGLDNRVDGVICLALPAELRRAHIARELPMVTVGMSVPDVPGVRMDDEQLGYLATRHLTELGHRRIAFVGLDPSDRYGLATAAERYAGYQQALAATGLTEDPDLVLTSGFELAGGEAAFEELIIRAESQREALPSGVVAVSDEVAFGIMYAARQWGIRVPEDLSIIGIDDHEMARFFDLTTVAQPVVEQGRQAAEILRDLMRTGAVPHPLLRTLTPGLIVRNSTAPL